MATVLHETRVMREPNTARDGRADGEPAALQPSRVNVGENERNVSMVAGAIVALQGLSRGTLPGLVSAAVGGYLIYRGAAGHCPVYQALHLDTKHTDGQVPQDQIAEKGVHVEQSMLIQRPAEKLYRYWRNFENLPQIMTHLKSVNRIDDRHTHWVASIPTLLGGQIEWDAEITTEEPNRLIAWRSMPGSQIDIAGQIRFTPAPGDRGTEVHVYMDYVPPAGKLGHWISWLLDETPETKMRDDLGNFKRLMETGELLTTIGQPRGTCLGTGKIQENL